MLPAKTSLPHYKVIGLLASPRFQKCRYVVEKLHLRYPKQYQEPEIRAMFDLDWELYLTKMRRRYGNPYYLLTDPVAVFYNDELLGGEKVFMEIISKQYHLNLNVDFDKLAEAKTMEYFENMTKKFQRQFAYLTIAIDDTVTGSMLFMLYNDLVPKTCENFLNQCTNQRPNYSYKNTKIHRIAKYSWIQCGGYNLHRSTHIPCESYAVPHDKRGVLSMCNSGQHVNNSTQFLITLEKTPWMDYHYVAFGQLIQGAEILNRIEKMSTYHQSPEYDIIITNCGKFSLCPDVDEEYTKALKPPYNTLFDKQVANDDNDSILSARRYYAGNYFLKSDLKTYMPFTRYSRLFETYMKNVKDGQTEHSEVEEQKQGHVHEQELFNLTKPSQHFYLRKKNCFN